MDLAPNGIDIFYIDESEREPLSVVTCVRIPFLRPKEDGWEFVWSRYEQAAIKWRRDLSSKHSIRFREELHGYKILGRQGLFRKEWRNLTNEEAVALYSDALATLTWLPEQSIMSAYATSGSELMGHKGIFACLFGLFQRIRNQCHHTDVNGMAFFDGTHESYVRLYRMAQKFLLTGSKYGGWSDGRLTRNMPLAMFPKDGNFKSSHLSYFMQVADLVAYCARLKLEHERGNLSAKRAARGDHNLYESIPRAKLNLAVTMKRRDAITPAT